MYRTETKMEFASAVQPDAGFPPGPLLKQFPVFANCFAYSVSGHAYSSRWWALFVPDTLWMTRSTATSARFPLVGQGIIRAVHAYVVRLDGTA